ncbi:MAG: hypothetical protein JXA23_00240 [Bacteroidales bacterium]|nr:hypothetical protein [Bacteroidales bacterium]
MIATGHQLPVTSEILFDYQAGAIPLKGSSRIPLMPDEIKKKSPISLWNTALEFHTARIFEPLLGPWYILVVPLVGLFTLEISIVGFLVWFIARKNKRSDQNRNPRNR